MSNMHAALGFATSTLFELRFNDTVRIADHELREDTVRPHLERQR